MSTHYSTNGEPTYERKRYVVENFKNIKAVESMLRTFGVCIIPNLFCKESSKMMFMNIVSELEKYIPGFRYADVRTWPLIRKAKATHGMILQHYGYGWLKSIVSIRTKKRCMSIFARLFSWLDYGRHGVKNKKYSKWDLFSSADGFSMYLNPDLIAKERKRPDELGETYYKPNKAGYHRKNHDWLHWDQKPDCKLNSFQGFVNLLDPTPGRVDATFTFLESSNRYQKEFQMKFWAESTDPKQYNPRFFRLENQDHYNFYTVLKGCPHMALALEAGDFVLWDSRLIHQGRNALRPDSNDLKINFGMQRSVVYVSMQPKCYAKPVDLKNKKRAFTQARTTTHDAANGVQLFPKKPRIYSKEEKALLDAGKLAMGVEALLPEEFTKIQKSLFGI